MNRASGRYSGDRHRCRESACHGGPHVCSHRIILIFNNVLHQDYSIKENTTQRSCKKKSIFFAKSMNMMLTNNSKVFSTLNGDLQDQFSNRRCED
jgi:hypothetical protein